MQARQSDLSDANSSTSSSGEVDVTNVTPAQDEQDYDSGGGEIEDPQVNEDVMDVQSPLTRKNAGCTIS